MELTPTSAPIQLLFPMGGLGTRFADIGIKTPKPLIEVDGQPMILKAISSFSRLLENNNNDTDSTSRNSSYKIIPIFIVRKEHEGEFGLATMLQKVVPTAKIVILDHDTRGAVETCLVAQSAFDLDAPLVVCDCDLFFKCKAYEEYLMKMADAQLAAKTGGRSNNSNNAAPDGLLVYMESEHPRYSFCQTTLENGEERVIRTAEKVPISNKAIIGAYAFRSAAMFCHYANQLVDLPIDPEKGRKEYYVSLVYNFVLMNDSANKNDHDEQSGKKVPKVVAVKRDEYESFGTPEELKEYVEKKSSNKK